MNSESEIIDIAPVVRPLAPDPTPNEVKPTRRQFVPRSQRPAQGNEPSSPESSQTNFSVHNYYRTSPLLVLGGFFYFLLWTITGRVYPASLANLLWPDSYLLVQLLLAAGNFLTVTYICQSVAWGKWAALTAAAWLFFRLAHFLWTPPLVGALLMISAIWWYLIVGRARPRAKSQKVPESSG